MYKTVNGRLELTMNTHMQIRSMGAMQVKKTNMLCEIQRFKCFKLYTHEKELFQL